MAQAIIEEIKASDGAAERAVQNSMEEKKAAEAAPSQARSEESESATQTPAATKRDWVKEAYECFVKDAKDIDPTDPVKAIEVYFEKNATDELKARCKAEGKDAEGCWKFIEAVARKALHGSSGHIDPAVVYAIAMHWFEDVPKDWDTASAKAPARQASKKPTTRKERLEERVSHGSTKAKAELRELKKKERAKAKAAKKRKSKAQQGFFFEMLETPVESEVDDE